MAQNFSGGVVPTDEDPLNAMAGMPNLSAALASVQSVLAFGRKLHGIGGREQGGGEEDQGGVINEAAAMPTIPGSQSGGPREQPAPGRLPPTSNPFGKRAEASPDGDEGGAIDTDDDEEMA